MKKLITGLFLLSGFFIQAQGEFSPSLLRNIEMIFDDNFIDYTRLTNLDPTVSPADTFGVVDFQKDANGFYLNGREWSDTIYGNWDCSNAAGVNIVAIRDAFSQDTVQIDYIFRDANGLDSLYQIYADTTGNGQLSLAQELALYYNGNGRLDSARAGVPGQGALGEIGYYYFRDANGRCDSLLLSINFMGTSFPVQTVRFYYGSNGLDSANLYSNFNNTVEEQVRVTNDANGKISSFSFYDLDVNNEWSLYDTYILSNENFFSIREAAAIAKADIQLFPNPSTRFINIVSDDHSSFEIVNMQGQLMLSGSLDRQDQVQVESLAKGTYILRIKTDKGLIGEKQFVKK